MRNKIFILLLILFVFMLSSCKKRSDNSRLEKESILTNKSDVRKTGDLDLIVSSVLETKKSIVEISEKYNSQIISERIYDNSELIKTGYFKIKVKAEDFSIVFDDLSNLGKIVKTNIRSEDISDKKNKNIDQIELLKQRIKDAEKTNNFKLIDSLKAKLNNLEMKKNEISNEIIYSYIFLEIKEKSKFIQSIVSGFKIGISGFYYATKYTIIILLFLIPLFVFIIIFKILYALIKWKWKYFINKIELAFCKNEKDKLE